MKLAWLGLPAFMKGSARHTELLDDFNGKTSFLRTIRNRAGIERGGSPGDNRQYDTGFGLMSGSLLRRKNNAETTLSMNGGSEESGKSTSTSAGKSEDVDSSTSSGIAGKLLRGLSSPMPLDTSVATSATVSKCPPTRRLSLGPFSSTVSRGMSTLTSAAADVLVLEASSTSPTTSSSHETIAPCTSPMASLAGVPLYEHFLVIGVSVETALDVSNQLRQKSATLSDRLMSRIETFFSSRNNSADIVPDVKSRSAISSNIFSRMMSSESQDVPHPDKGKSMWGTGLLSRMTSREVSSRDCHEALDIPHTDDSLTPPAECPALHANGDKRQSTTCDLENMRCVCAPSVGSGSKNEHCTYTSPEILYRHPPDADTPPPEVCDFCMPSGGKLRHLQPSDAETSIMEILYGQGQSQRSSRYNSSVVSPWCTTKKSMYLRCRCFIFILEDKTVDISKVHPDDESGKDTGRTYGICVVHPRLLNPSIADKDLRKSNLSGDINRPEEDSRHIIEFDASVCYCFITRFPLFEFFFKVIFNIISYERIVRMEKITENTDLIDRTAYEYIPKGVYDTVLQKLSALVPPRYDKAIEFTISPTVSTVTYIRTAPSGNYPEHVVNAAEWALPPLVHWLSPKIIAWALGLLMCEVYRWVI